MSVRGDSMLRDRELLESELRDKIELYSELTGEDGWSVPVARVADFISGFEMGKERFRKRGHWKVVPFNSKHGEYRPNAYECSECGWKIDLCRGLQQDTGHRLFCEHCGADMRGES